MPPFLYSSIFGELTKNVQIRFDAASELNKKLFDNVIFERFMDWDTPTIGLVKLKINKFGCVIGSPVDSEYKNKNNGKCYDQNLAPGILSGDNFTDTYFLLF